MGILSVNDNVTDIMEAHPIDDKLVDVGINRLLWANRRRMAYISLYALLSACGFLLLAITFSDGMADRIVKNNDIIGWILTFMFGHTASYMASNMVSDVASLMNSVKPNASKMMVETTTTNPAARTTTTLTTTPQDPA